MARCTQKKIVLPPVCMHPCAPPPCCPPCPPPCCPSPCCPPCCPPPCCPPSFPCMPSGPPCCPPKACCGPKVPCCPCPPGCCKPMNLCNCCGGKSTIICVPKGCPPPGCCGPCYQSCCGPCCPPYCSPCCPPSCGPPCAEEKPASFNNCNFYCSELPNGVKVGGNNNSCIDPMCMEEDPCCYDGMNRAAGDDQLAPAPRSGTLSSAPSSSRHGGSSSHKSSSMASKKRVRGGVGKRSSNTESIEGYEDENTQGGSSKTGSSTGKGSSTPSYSYTKSAMHQKTLHKQKVRNPQLSGLLPKTEKKRYGTTVTDSSPAARQNDSCLRGKRYSTFAEAMSPILNAANLAKGDVSSDRRLGYRGNTRHSGTDTKLKLEEITFPVRNNGRNRSQCHDTTNSKEREDLVLGGKHLDGGESESINANIFKPLCRDNPSQLGAYPEAATKSSEFSTKQIFGRSPTTCVSSSTICAPVTTYTPSAPADNAHDTSEQFFSGSESRVRRSKSAGGLHYPLGKPTVSSSTVLEVSPGLGELVCRQEGYRSLLKTADDIHKKLVMVEQPICVMTCLIDRANTKKEMKKALALSSSQNDEAEGLFATEAKSYLTGCNSGTDYPPPAENRNITKVAQKSCEGVEIIPSSQKSSRITMKSFFSSGAIALPPSRRRWGLNTGHEFSASSADGRDVCDDNGKQPLKYTRLPPTSLSGDSPDSFKSFSMKISSSDVSSTAKPNLARNGGQNVIMPQRNQPSCKFAAQQKSLKLPPVTFSIQLPAIGHPTIQHKGSLFEDEKIQAHVTLSPITPNPFTGSGYQSENATMNGQECKESLKLRRKRRVRRVFTGENSWPAGDTAFVGISNSLPYGSSIEKQ